MTPLNALIAFVALAGIVGLILGARRGPRITTIETRRETGDDTGDPAP